MIATDIALGGRPTPVPYDVVLTSPAAKVTVELLDHRGADVAGETSDVAPAVRVFTGVVSVDASSLPVLAGAHWVVTVWSPAGVALASKTVAVHVRARGLIHLGAQIVDGHRSVVGLARRWSAATGGYVPLAGQAVEVGLVDHGTLDGFRYVRTDAAGRLETDVTGLHATFVLVLLRTAGVSGARSRPLTF